MGKSKLVKTQKITNFGIGRFSQKLSSEILEYFANRNRPDINFGFIGGKEICTARPRRESRRSFAGCEEVNNPVERF